MSGKLDDDDRRYLRMAVELSRSYRDDPRRWPFGAIVVGQGKVLGRGFNQVVELRDPSAHAEIMALRAAGGALGRHALEDCVLYSMREDADREEVRRDAVLAVQDWAQRADRR